MCWCDPNKRTPWCGKPGCQRQAERKPADQKEPAPVVNDQPFVQEAVIADLAIMTDPIARSLAYDLRIRADYGLRKYGTLLQPHNGRNAANDAYQEALDLVVYLKQCCMEGQNLDVEYAAALGLAGSLSRRLIG